MNFLFKVLLAIVLFSATFLQAEEVRRDARASLTTLEAMVTDINLEAGQVTLLGPMGNLVTVTPADPVVDLEDINIGDLLEVSYLQAMEGELRAPTEEELAEPFVVLEDMVISEDPDMPHMEAGRVIRAVCTIEGMNRLTGTVTLMGPNGGVHVIGDVEPEKMEGITLGQTVIVVYTEAVALSLEKVAAEPAAM